MLEITENSGSLKPSFLKQRFSQVQNAAPLELATQCHNLFVDADYNTITQTRKDHFSHVFSIPDKDLPQDDEVYIARFSRSGQPERNEIIRPWSIHI